MSPKTVPCAKAVRAGRLRKAEQFLTVAAETLDLAGEQHDVGDAYATLCVTAGIAAADVICCALLGSTRRARTTVRPSHCSGRPTRWRPGTSTRCSG